MTAQEPKLPPQRNKIPLPYDYRNLRCKHNRERGGAMTEQKQPFTTKIDNNLFFIEKEDSAHIIKKDDVRLIKKIYSDNMCPAIYIKYANYSQCEDEDTILFDNELWRNLTFNKIKAFLMQKKSSVEEIRVLKDNFCLEPNVIMSDDGEIKHNEQGFLDIFTDEEKDAAKKAIGEYRLKKAEEKMHITYLARNIEKNAIIDEE